MTIRKVNKVLRDNGFEVNGKSKAVRDHAGRIVQSTGLSRGVTTRTNSDGSIFVSVNRAKDTDAVVAALEAAGATVEDSPFVLGYDVR